MITAEVDEPYLQITVTDLADRDEPTVTHYLTMRDTDVLASTLTIERNRARFLPTPAVHPTQDRVNG